MLRKTATLDDLADALGLSDKPNNATASIEWGVVDSVNSDGTLQVSLNSSDVSVKAATLQSVSAGARVLAVILKSGETVVIGGVISG